MSRSHFDIVNRIGYMYQYYDIDLSVNSDCIILLL